MTDDLKFYLGMHEPTVHTCANENGGYDIVLNFDGGYGKEDAERMAKFSADRLNEYGLNVTLKDHAA